MAKEKEKSFEENLKELESIVEKLERSRFFRILW